MLDSDVFIISAARAADPAQAIRQAVQEIGLKPERVQDVLLGFDEASALPDLEGILRAAGLACPSAAVSSSLRAIFFAAQSILSGDVDIVLVVGLHAGDSAALLMASPDAVGRWNLSPRARLAVRSLAGVEPALRAAGLESGEVTITKRGQYGASLMKELLDELEQRPARWGMVAVNELTLLVERI